MNAVKNIFLLGLFIAFMPFSGLPRFWETVIMVGLALVISTLAFFLPEFSARPKLKYGNTARRKKRSTASVKQPVKKQEVKTDGEEEGVRFLMDEDEWPIFSKERDKINSQ